MATALYSPGRLSGSVLSETARRRCRPYTPKCCRRPCRSKPPRRRKPDRAARRLVFPVPVPRRLTRRSASLRDTIRRAVSSCRATASRSPASRCLRRSSSQQTSASFPAQSTDELAHAAGAARPSSSHDGPHGSRNTQLEVHIFRVPANGARRNSRTETARPSQTRQPLRSPTS